MASETKRAHRQFDDQVASYCFGDLADERRNAFELHLLTCERCFREVERLMAGVQALRASVDASTRSLDRSEIIGLLGISGDFGERFAGHGQFVAVVTTAYAALSAEAVLTELSYFMDRFRGIAAWTVPFAFMWVGLALLVALLVSLKLARAERGDALVTSAAALVGGVGLMLIGAHYALPHEASISSNFVPRTVAAANLRNYALYGLPLAILYVLVPFHFVVTIQRELARGRHENVLKFFSRDPLAISPRGALFLPPKALAGLLVIAVVYLVVANQYLLDNLTPGPHAELFATLIYVRIIAGLSVAGGGLAWYSRMLNEAKREALAMGQTSGPVSH